MDVEPPDFGIGSFPEDTSVSIVSLPVCNPISSREYDTSSFLEPAQPYKGPLPVVLEGLQSLGPALLDDPPHAVVLAI